MKIILIFLITVFVISTSESTIRKQPGVKYSDTLKQARADKAAASGRVVPKQAGVSYRDTLSQVANNQRAAEGKVMNKISGQSYRNTLGGVAKSKDSNKQLKEHREKLQKEAKKLREAMESGGSAKITELSEKMKKDLILWNRYVTQLEWRIFTIEQVEAKGLDYFSEDYQQFFNKYVTLDKDDIWNLVVQVDLNRMDYESHSYLTYFEDIDKLEGKDREIFFKFLVWPSNMDYNIQRLPFEFFYKLRIKYHRENGESWESAKIKAEKDTRKKIKDILKEKCKIFKNIDYSDLDLVLHKMIYFEGYLDVQALKILKKIGFKNLSSFNVRSCY